MIDVEPLEEILARFADGETEPAWALMELLVATDDVSDAESWLESQRDEPLAKQLLALLAQHRAGSESVVKLARDHARLQEIEPGERVIEACARFFDRAVEESEQGSVALYSLGSEEILETATDEIVSLLSTWNALGTDRDVLQIGCGIGRIERAIARQVRTAVGIDVSANMIEAARRRCEGLTNVHFETTEGRDLARFESQQFDLVYAIDSVPYLVLAGEELVLTHFEESRRVLKPGGQFIVLNFSYRGDSSADLADVARLSAACGLSVESGAAPGSLWDGRAYRMVRRDE